MKQTFKYLLATLFGAGLALSLAATASPEASGWQLVYEHDKDGGALSGSKQQLIDAIAAGKPVRLYWAGRRVQHVTDAAFLTVLQGEVFAQIRPIKGQKPSTDPAAIELRDNEWVAVFATNGDRALRWFVDY